MHREGERERERTVDHILSVCSTMVILSISKDVIESIVSYTGYYVKTLTCPTQITGMNVSHNQ